MCWFVEHIHAHASPDTYIYVQDSLITIDFTTSHQPSMVLDLLR